MVLNGVNSKSLKNGDPEPPAPKSGTYRVYNMRFCPYAERVMIYLAAKKIPAEVINIHLQEKPEWFFKKHFQGKVPVIEHDGKVVIESAVIPEYLDDVLLESRILPTDAYEKAQQKLLAERLSAITQGFFGLVAAAKDPSVKQEKVAATNKSFGDAETLLTHPFFGGEKAGYADYMVFPFVERVWWLSKGFDFGFAGEFPGPQYPKLQKWFNTVLHLPEVQEVTQPADLGLKFCEGYIQGKMDYDLGI